MELLIIVAIAVLVIVAAKVLPKHFPANRTKKNTAPDKTEKLQSLLVDIFHNGGDFVAHSEQILQTTADSLIGADEVKYAMVKSFDLAVDSFLEDGLISDEERNAVNSFVSFSQLSTTELDRYGSIQKIFKSDVLQSIDRGVIPDCPMDFDRKLPILIPKSEKLIWVFPRVEFFEQRTKKQYVGASQGVSVRIMKGVYYRTGSFKGTPVETTAMHSLGQCIVALTDKTLYVSGATKSIKIPYGKIITIDPYTNGIGLQRDGVSFKPMVLENVDGWFISNLISALVDN